MTIRLQIASAKLTNETKNPRFRAAQRGRGEADHAGRRKAEHLPKGILRLAGEALVTPVEDARLAQPDPAEHAADEAVALPHAHEHVERAPVDEPEVAHVEGP